MSSWTFYWKTEKRTQRQYLATTVKEADQCRQRMLGRFGDASTEIRRDGVVIHDNNAPIAA
jgi:hypothetical protein